MDGGMYVRDIASRLGAIDLLCSSLLLVGLCNALLFMFVSLLLLLLIYIR